LKNKHYVDPRIRQDHARLALAWTLQALAGTTTALHVFVLEQEVKRLGSEAGVKLTPLRRPWGK
jgi:hypothetical protein